MYAPAALRLQTKVMLRHLPISMKISTIMIIWPNAMMFSFCVKSCRVYLQRSALIDTSAIVMGIDVLSVLKTLLYAASSLPAPTRWPVMICVDMAQAFEKIIARDMSVLQ